MVMLLMESELSLNGSDAKRHAPGVPVTALEMESASVLANWETFTIAYSPKTEADSVPMTAANDGFVAAHGPTLAYVAAGRDAGAWSASSLSGGLNAGRDAGAIALGSSNILIHAGQDAYAWAFTGYNGSLTAGRDAFVESWRGIDAQVTAGRDGGMLSIDYAIGAIDAERYAGLITWGTAAGPMTVDGKEGAFGWVYKDFIGEVRSAHGDAYLIVYGNAVGAGRLAAGGRDAAAWVVGDAVGGVEAGEYAGAVVLGDFHGYLTAGADGFIASEGHVSASMDTGGDLSVYSFDGVTGNYHAGRDAAVMTYGDFDALLSADRDIGSGHYNYYGTAGVWARGDIRGTIAAGRNIGHWDHYYGYQYGGSSAFDIFSYGSINAVITAENPSGSSIGGRIGSVAARGSIDGLIRAAHSIQLVHAGQAIDAAIVAPYIGSVIENDASLGNFAYPDRPESIKAEVLAEAAAVYDEVLALREDLAEAIAESLEAFAADKAAALAELAEYQAAVDQALADAREEIHDALEADIERWAAARARVQQEAVRQLTDSLRLAEQAKTDLLDDIASAAAAADAAHQEALEGKQAVIDALTVCDTGMLALRDADAEAAWRDKCAFVNDLWRRLAEEAAARAESEVGLYDTVDRFFAGYAWIWTFGTSNLLRGWAYGELATRNHRGMAFNVGAATALVQAIFIGYRSVRLAPRGGLLDRIGNANLPYRTRITTGVKVSRFFATRTSYQHVINRSPITKWLHSRGWQSHHWCIPRSQGLGGSEGLRRITEAGWNLIPLPARWNRAISNGGRGFKVTRLLVGASPGIAFYGGYTLGSFVVDIGWWLTGEDPADE